MIPDRPMLVKYYFEAVRAFNEARSVYVLLKLLSGGEFVPVHFPAYSLFSLDELSTVYLLLSKLASIDNVQKPQDKMI